MKQNTVYCEEYIFVKKTQRTNQYSRSGNFSEFNIFLALVEFFVYLMQSVRTKP